MQSDKQHEKKSILGELESIKDLLNEAELDNIPLLQDAITLALDEKTPESVDSAWGTLTELPDFVEESPPETPADTTPLELDPDTLAELNQATQAINDVYNTYSSAFDRADDHSFDGDGSWADDSALIGDNASDSPTDANPAEDVQSSEESSDLGVAEAISAYESLFAEVGVDINPSTEEQLEAQFYQEELTSTPFAEGLSYDQQLDQGLDNLDDEALQPAIDDINLPAEDESPAATLVQETSTQEALVQEALPQEWDEDDSAPSFTQEPFSIDLPPGVLPGQQSLFEPLVESTRAISTNSADTFPLVEANNHIESGLKEEDTLDDAEDLNEIANAAAVAAPHQLRQSNSVEAPKQEPPHKFPTSRHEHKPVKARGENPFLPKHIRERLHTNKALVDIINEEHAHKIAQASQTAKQAANTGPSSSGVSNAGAPALEQIINSVMAEYLPRIEQELRRKLQQYLQEHLTEQQKEKQQRE